MKVDVEILKGNSKGKTKTINAYRARVLEKVGFLKVIRTIPEPEQKSNTYQTRMMQADTTVADHIPQREPSLETDTAGVMWNSDVHVATKLKNQDGTWRKKPGAKTEQ